MIGELRWKEDMGPVPETREGNKTGKRDAVRLRDDSQTDTEEGGQKFGCVVRGKAIMRRKRRFSKRMKCTAFELIMVYMFVV